MSTDDIDAIEARDRFYGSMIGGMFIMTAHLPNLILVNLFAGSGFTINYLQWMWRWSWLNGMALFTTHR